MTCPYTDKIIDVQMAQVPSPLRNLHKDKRFHNFKENMFPILLLYDSISALTALETAPKYTCDKFSNEDRNHDVKTRYLLST